MSGIVSKNAGRGSGIIGAGDIGADAVDGSNIADDAIDSEHYTDGSIDNAHIADDAIDSEHYADGSIDNAHIADDAIDSEHYADGSIDNAHIADDALDSEHYADGSIDTAHIADNAITLAKMAGGTDGNIISFDASGDPVAIATGSDGQVLTSAGAGAPPAFEAAAGGGLWEYISTVTASTSATLAFTNMADGYDYRYVIEELFVSADTAVIRAQLGVTTPTYRTSGYLSVATTIINNNSSQSTEATAHIMLTAENEASGTGTDEGIKYSELTLINPAGTSVATMVMGFIFLYGHSPQAQVQHFGSFYNTADEAHTAIKFFMSTGTITTGNILQYRRKRS